MKKFNISLIFGLIAGVIDVTPMIIQKIDIYACVSAFVQWIILSIVIFHINIGLHGFIKGVIVTVLMNIPIMVIISKTEPMSIIPILVMSVILGGTLGLAGEKYSGRFSTPVD